jgi:hypothetical protein
MAFFTILGVIVCFFICKFIYDSYITNNTEKNWQEFKQKNPNDPEVLITNKQEADLAFAMGRHKWKDHDYFGAIKCFKVASDLDPTNRDYKKVYQETTDYIAQMAVEYEKDKQQNKHLEKGDEDAHF